jgi:hypothetical protein
MQVQRQRPRQNMSPDAWLHRNWLTEDFSRSANELIKNEKRRKDRPELNPGMVAPQGRGLPKGNAAETADC